MSDKYTHVGVIKATPHNLPIGAKAEVKLRRSGKVWTDQEGRKFDFDTGVMLGTEQPPWRLQRSSVRHRDAIVIHKPSPAMSPPPPPVPNPTIKDVPASVEAQVEAVAGAVQADTAAVMAQTEAAVGPGPKELGELTKAAVADKEKKAELEGESKATSTPPMAKRTPAPPPNPKQPYQAPGLEKLARGSKPSSMRGRGGKRGA